MKVHAYRLALAVLFASSCVVSAAIEMPGIFSDHMVLQRDRPVPVWGKAAPGEKVKVSFRGQTKETSADSNGFWSVSLDAMQALPDQKPDVMTVEAGSRIEFKDVLVGEVWLGSGQSNMVWPLTSCKNGQEEIAAADEPMKAIRVHFEHTGSGLTARGGEPLQGFSIAGADRNFVWANARIDGDSVVLWSEKVPEPRAVQYAWSESAPWANLFNRDGFPALIFQSDPGDR